MVDTNIFSKDVKILGSDKKSNTCIIYNVYSYVKTNQNVDIYLGKIKI